MNYEAKVADMSGTPRVLAPTKPGSAPTVAEYPAWTPDGEAMRNDDEFSYVAAWEFGPDRPVLHKEDLTFSYVHPSTRSYK